MCVGTVCTDKIVKMIVFVSTFRTFHANCYGCSPLSYHSGTPSIALGISLIAGWRGTVAPADDVVGMLQRHLAHDAVDDLTGENFNEKIRSPLAPERFPTGNGRNHASPPTSALENLMASRLYLNQNPVFVCQAAAPLPAGPQYRPYNASDGS